MAEVSKTIRQYPVNFKGAQIIPGKDEGAYGWITINYLLESFTKVSPLAGFRSARQVNWRLAWALKEDSPKS